MSEPRWRRYARLWGPNVGADVDEELEFHVQTRADANVGAGMTPAEARARAEREFGDIARARRECRAIGDEQVRLRRRAELRGVFATDARFALRMLRRNPLFATVAVLTLALGIGATTTLYSALDAVLLRPLPFAAPNRLVQIWEDNPAVDFGTHDIPTSPANFVDWRERAGTIDEMGAFRFSGFALTGGGAAEQLTAIDITPGLFRVLGVAPLLGRTFAEEDARAGASRVVVLSHEFWQRRYGGRADVVGMAALLDGVPYTIVGVMAPEFRFPYAQMYPIAKRAGVDIYVPMTLDPEALRNWRGARALGVIGRLAAGASVEQTRAELTGIHAQLAEEYPQHNGGWHVRVVSLPAQVSGGVRLELTVLFSAVVLLLLIACANVGNLLLARGLGRERELALRTALGAGRGRVVRQLLTESLVLALIGGAAGLALAHAGVRSLVRLVPEGFPRLADVTVNGRVALFTLAASLLTGLLFGALPALRARGIDLRTAMQSGGRTMTAGRRARATANGLVVFQVALAVVLLAGAGLLIRSFAQLTAVQPGFRADGLVVGGVALPETRYSDTERRRLAYHEILAHVAVAPGVAQAALTGLMPFTDTEDFEGVRIEGVTLPESAQPPIVRYYVVTPGYFSTLEIPLLAGRALEDGDHAGSLPVAVINQAMADALFADQDPIGRRVTLADTSWRTIVGVVGSVRYSGLDAEPQPEAYVPLAQADWPYMLVVARTTAGPDVVVPGLRAAVARFDRDLPLSDVRSIEGLRANSLAQRRLNMLLLVAFAALALVLAAVGLYGVLGQDVARRQQEIGVRLALGASPAVALRLILRDAALMIGAGAGIGVVAALALSRLLTGLLYGIPAYDALTFATVTLFIIAVALVASYLPARRAMRTDPLTALRAE